MKYKTLFRVLLKFMGVWISIESIATLVYAFMNGCVNFIGDNRDYLATNAMDAVWSCGYLGIGLYLFFGGKLITDLAIPGNRLYCHECGYDLSHSPGINCPECGTEFKPDSEHSM
tara:strand:- start:490 stop:834 length:345 start_codon:yes stop_codon:yes gene_type:complete